MTDNRVQQGEFHPCASFPVRGRRRGREDSPQRHRDTEKKVLGFAVAAATLYHSAWTARSATKVISQGVRETARSLPDSPSPRKYFYCASRGLFGETERGCGTAAFRHFFSVPLRLCGESFSRSGGRTARKARRSVSVFTMSKSVRDLPRRPESASDLGGREGEPLGDKDDLQQQTSALCCRFGTETRARRIATHPRPHLPLVGRSTRAASASTPTYAKASAGQQSLLVRRSFSAGGSGGARAGGSTPPDTIRRRGLCRPPHQGEAGFCACREHF